MAANLPILVMSCFFAFSRSAGSLRTVKFAMPGGMHLRMHCWLTAAGSSTVDNSNRKGTTDALAFWMSSVI
ncbi:hypothetical protein BJX64DRAFT_248497 [Aspergillus heterothallicus]